MKIVFQDEKILLLLKKADNLLDSKKRQSSIQNNLFNFISKRLVKLFSVEDDSEDLRFEDLISTFKKDCCFWDKRKIMLSEKVCVEDKMFQREDFQREDQLKL